MANKSFIVQYIIRARDQFSKQTDLIARSSTKMRKSIDKARLSFRKFALKAQESARKIRASLLKIRSGFGDIARKARNAGTVMAAAVTLPILLMAKSFKDAARDAVETRSKFATVYKSIGNEAELAADKLAESFGLSGTKARELLGDTGDLLSGFGFTGKAALDMSTKVNELAVDLASFTNFSGGAEGASAALTKALLGERESLKTLGIAILEEDVKAKVRMMTAKGATFASMRQAKAAATLALAIEQSKNAIGDFARTSQELANQERITASRVQDLKEKFGAILLPVALKLTQAIRSMAIWLTELSPTTKKVILIIAGLVAVIAPLLLLVSAIIFAIPALATGFAALGTALLFVGGIMKAVGAALLLNPIGLTITAIALAAFAVYKNWKPIKSFFIDLWGSITDGAEKLWQKIQPIIDMIVSLKNAGIEFVSNVTENVKSKISSARDALGIGGLAPLELSSSGNVSVDLNVGLDQGLQQTTKPKVSSFGTRRADVGFAQ